MVSPADAAPAFDDGCDRHWFPRGDTRRDSLEFRPGRGVHPLDEHVDDAAAGEADREHIVIADTVSLQLCNAMAENLLAGGEDFGLDATAAHRTDHLT